LLLLRYRLLIITRKLVLFVIITIINFIVYLAFEGDAKNVNIKLGLDWQAQP